MRLSQLVRAGINDPYIFKAIFLSGGGASGKGYIGSHMFKGTGLKFLNSDISFEFLLKQRGLSMDLHETDPEYDEKMRLRSIAKQMEKVQQVSWINGMLGLVFDGTGKDVSKIKGGREGLEAIGYDTGMVFVNTSLEVARERSIQRAKGGGRHIDEKILEKAWHGAQAAAKYYRGTFGSANFFEVDNSTTLEQNSQAEKELGMELRRKALGWLNRPLKNPTGQAIVQYLKQTGGKLLSDFEKAADDLFNEEQKAASARR